MTALLRGVPVSPLGHGCDLQRTRGRTHSKGTRAQLTPGLSVGRRPAPEGRAAVWGRGLWAPAVLACSVP